VKGIVLSVPSVAESGRIVVTGGGMGTTGLALSSMEVVVMLSKSTLGCSNVGSIVAAAISHSMVILEMSWQRVSMTEMGCISLQSKSMSHNRATDGPVNHLKTSKLYQCFRYLGRYVMKCWALFQ